MSAHAFSESRATIQDDTIQDDTIPADLMVAFHRRLKALRSGVHPGLSAMLLGSELLGSD
jgi:hypothetical protein